MRHILLLGAGFSRNWGGLLASEIFDSLIGRKDVAQDPYLKGVLWKHKTAGGFENALEEVQLAAAQDPATYGASLQKFQAAVIAVFGDMNRGFFEMSGIEFQVFANRMLRTFLARFDAIFSLNQDVLLEHHYVHHLPTSGKWTGAQFPGLQRIPDSAATIPPSWGKDIWVPLPETDFQVRKGAQPIFKLHGSSNWRDALGGSLLVIGGNKSNLIQSHKVLAWSFEQFGRCLTEAPARLFVIGYGFRDQHINDAIIKAANNHGLEFFVVDRLGSDVVRHANPSFGGAIYAPNELDDAFKKGLIGALSRNLSEIFGADVIAHQTVSSFFEQ